MNAASNSFFSRCRNCENEPETFLYKPWSQKHPKFARTTQQIALVSDKIVNDVPKTYFINRAGRDLPNYIWTQLQTDLFPDTELINAFSDEIRNYNKRSGTLVNLRRPSGQRSKICTFSAWLREFKRKSNAVSNVLYVWTDRAFSSLTAVCLRCDLRTA